MAPATIPEPACGWGVNPLAVREVDGWRVWTTADGEERPCDTPDKVVEGDPPDNWRVFLFDQNVTEKQLVSADWLPPANVLLDDICIFLTIVLIPTKSTRARRWPYSFTQNGAIRPNRVAFGNAPKVQLSDVSGRILGYYFLVSCTGVCLRGASGNRNLTLHFRKRITGQKIRVNAPWTFGTQQTTLTANRTKNLVLEMDEDGTSRNLPLPKGLGHLIEKHKWVEMMIRNRDWPVLVSNSLRQKLELAKQVVSSPDGTTEVMLATQDHGTKCGQPDSDVDQDAIPSNSMSNQAHLQTEDGCDPAAPATNFDEDMLTSIEADEEKFQKQRHEVIEGYKKASEAHKRASELSAKASEDLKQAEERCRKAREAQLQADEDYKQAHERAKLLQQVLRGLAK